MPSLTTTMNAVVVVNVDIDIDVDIDVVGIMTITSDYPLQLALGFFVDGWVAIKLCISIVRLTHGGQKNKILIMKKKKKKNSTQDGEKLLQSQSQPLSAVQVPVVVCCL